MLKIPEEYINMYSEIKPAYRKVYNILRATILSGQISSAVHLTEVSISQALHVSRTPVRMALEQLKNDGILSTVKKNRVGVKQLSKSDKINLLFLDELLESTAARLAATAITDEDLETLMELNDSMREFSYNEKDVPDIRVNGVRDLNMQFHLMIARASGNQFLYKYIVEIRHLMRMHQANHLLRPNTFSAEIAPCHDRIIQAIKEREPEEAELWMRVDIRSGRNMYIHREIL